MSNTTLTIQSVVNLASTHIDLLPLAGVGGYSNEPALSLANDALQDILVAPYDWKFNRIELPVFFTALNKQDYLFAGASAFSLGATSTGVGIDLTSKNAITVAAGVVTVNTLEPHRFSVGDTVYMAGNTLVAYNSTFSDNGVSASWSGGWVITAVPSPTSFQFAATAGQNNADVTGAPGITDFGWAGSGTLAELNNTSSPQNIHPIEVVKELQPSGRTINRPEKVCMLHDYGTGVLKFRFQYVPSSTIWAVNIVYQAKAPLKIALTDNWAPFPDDYAYVYRQAFIYRAYRYLESPRADSEFQKLQQAINKALTGADRETSDVHVYPEQSLMDDGAWYGSY